VQIRFKDVNEQSKSGFKYSRSASVFGPA